MAQKKKRYSRLERTAYHEAGHAVMSFIRKRRFKYVTIIPEKDSLGHILHKPWSNFDPEVNDDARTSKKIETEALVSLSGHAVESLLTGKTMWQCASWQGDRHNAIDILSYSFPEGEELGAYFTWLFIHAKNILKQPLHWKAVQYLADELLIHKKIGYKKAREIIKKPFVEMEKQSPPLSGKARKFLTKKGKEANRGKA